MSVFLYNSPPAAGSIDPAQILDWLSDNESERAEADRRFDVRGMTDQYFALYRELIGKSPGKQSVTREPAMLVERQEEVSAVSGRPGSAPYKYDWGARDREKVTWRPAHEL